MNFINTKKLNSVQEKIPLMLTLDLLPFFLNSLAQTHNRMTKRALIVPAPCAHTHSLITPQVTQGHIPVKQITTFMHMGIANKSTCTPTEKAK